MRVLLLGSTGVLGKAIENALAGHVVLGASRTNAQRRADLADESTLERLLSSIGPVDAVVCAAGETPYQSVPGLTSDVLLDGLRTKLLGQIALARFAQPVLSDGGSVTLTAGVLNHLPIPGAACAAIANGGLEGFVRAAALEAHRRTRINLVSPGLLLESRDRYGAYFPHLTPVPAAEVAQAYVRSIEGKGNGEVFHIHRPSPAI